MTKPLPSEYGSFYANYVNLASAHPDVLKLLHDLAESTYKTFTTLPSCKAEYAYAEGKWTVKEMLGHMIDTERVFSYRLYCISRGDKTPLPGFEQDDYVANSTYKDCSIISLASEFRAVREANLYFIDNLTDAQLDMIGKASNSPVSVRALLYMLAGHELYHLNLLKERYLKH